VCYNAGSSEDGEEVVLKEATITYPQGVPQSLKMSDAEFAGEVQFLAAVKLYELGRLSSGKAAELAGMGRVDFLRSLAGVGVPAINLRDEEIDLEVAAARELAQ
jgi:predicted HTH domain antitoxin